MNKHFLKLATIALLPLAIASCKDGTDGAPGASGENGSNGTNGTNGADGSNGADGVNGLNSIIQHNTIFAGNSTCFNGGVEIVSGLDANEDGNLEASEISGSNSICNASTLDTTENFNRISTFYACEQIDANCNTDEEMLAEIAAVSKDGMTVIYTDGAQATLGFVDIADPANPVALGQLSLGDSSNADATAEPTSVAVIGDYAVAGVNTSPDYVNPTGHLAIIDIASQSIVHTIDMLGQPDSVAVSKDGNHIVIAIENERDEDLGDGYPGQAPTGFVMVVDTAADVMDWSATKIDLDGLTMLYADDAEPEYVSINDNNIAVVTLQENNHIVLIDVETKTVINDFSAGSIDLDNIDTTDVRPSDISLTESSPATLREPDGVTWINNEYFMTADEGDLDGGSRSFTIFNLEGDVVWDSNNTLDHMAVTLGHYPDKRSDAKGVEPENVAVGIYGDKRYAFVNAERAGLVFVYDLADPTRPLFKQALASSVGPEGSLAIGERNLLVVSAEKDAREDKMRGGLNIYQLNNTPAMYPMVKSLNDENGLPQSWGALSGLAADMNDANTIYSISDSFYAKNKIFTIDVSNKPAVITNAMTIKDSNDVFASITSTDHTPVDGEIDNVFSTDNLSALINDDKTINIDPEGITQVADGFWIASEGNGTIDELDRPINSLNFLVKVNNEGVIEDVVTLPTAVNDIQVRFGFEGVAESDGSLYVAFQRAWGSESEARIGIYDLTAKTWSFVMYPLDAPESQNAGWVGLSDITAMGDNKFLVLERDNQGGPDAAIKRIYEIDLDGVVAGDTVTKTLVKDLMMDLAKTNGMIAEKVEGLAVTQDGRAFIVSDNDGVDDHSGETVLLNINL